MRCEPGKLISFAKSSVNDNTVRLSTECRAKANGFVTEGQGYIVVHSHFRVLLKVYRRIVWCRYHRNGTSDRIHFHVSCGFHAKKIIVRTGLKVRFLVDVWHFVVDIYGIHNPKGAYSLWVLVNPVSITWHVPRWKYPKFFGAKWDHSDFTVASSSKSRRTCCVLTPCFEHSYPYRTHKRK